MEGYRSGHNGVVLKTAGFSQLTVRFFLDFSRLSGFLPFSFSSLFSCLFYIFSRLFFLVFFSKSPEFNMEGYRSGHNGVVLKTIRAQAHRGSNPLPSATASEQSPLCSGVLYFTGNRKRHSPAPLLLLPNPNPPCWASGLFFRSCVMHDSIFKPYPSRLCLCSTLCSSAKKWEPELKTDP